MDKKTLNNSKMGRLVARLFGKSELDVKDGKVSLSDQERQKVLENYGQDFLDKLESINLDVEGDAVTLFDAAVAAKTAEATAALTAQIEKLQNDVVSLASEPEPKPAATAVPASKEAKVFAINMAAAHNKIVKEALDSVNPYAFTAMEDASIDITDLNAEFKMTMPPKMKLELLNKRIYNGFDDAKHMTRIQSNTDYIASAAIMSEVSQQFTPKWTPKGSPHFTPIRIPYRRHKLNVLIQPADVLKSWLLYLYEQGKTMADMPITRYIIENHILPKVLDDITISMIARVSSSMLALSLTVTRARPPRTLWTVSRPSLWRASPMRTARSTTTRQQPTRWRCRTPSSSPTSTASWTASPDCSHTS